MSDLTDLQAAQTIKIAGATGTGSEANYAAVTSENRLLTESVFSGSIGGVQTSPFGALKTFELFPLIGDTFHGSTLDSVAWTKTENNAATVTIANNVCNLSTGTTANGNCTLFSSQTGHFSPGISNSLHMEVRLGDTGGANNVRRWGLFDATNGIFFQLNETTFGIVERVATVDTVVTSFNGDGAPVVDTNFHLYEIYFSQGTAYFLQDSVLIHTIDKDTAALANGPHLKIGYENTNSGGSTTDRDLYAFGPTLNAMGKLPGLPGYFHINSNGTNIIKRGPGILHRIVIGTRGLGANAATIYDNSAGSGTVISIVDSITTIGTLEMGCKFDTGLTVVTAGGTAGDIVIVYE